MLAELLAQFFLSLLHLQKSGTAIKRFIMGGEDKDPVQSLQVMRGQIRINSSNVLKSEFTELN